MNFLMAKNKFEYVTQFLETKGLRAQLFTKKDGGGIGMIVRCPQCGKFQRYLKLLINPNCTYCNLKIN